MDKWQELRQRCDQYGDNSYADFITQVSINHYAERVEHLGLTGYQDVLDVGCGLGQWTHALAQYNQRVVGVEIHSKRLEIARWLCQNDVLAQVEFVNASAAQLPFPDQSFDVLFCYGVFFLVPNPRQVLQEFWRVLRPQGKLYICTNGPGWWLSLALKNWRKNPRLARVAFSALHHGMRGKTPSTMTLKRLPRELGPQFRLLAAHGEGVIGAPHATSHAVYPAKFMRLDHVIEFLAEKQDIELSLSPTPMARHKIDIHPIIQQSVSATLQAQVLDYCGMMDELAHPKPVLDLVQNTDHERLNRSLSIAKTQSRSTVLQWLFTQLTHGLKQEEERILACLHFCQRHFFHHFAGQPIQNNALVTDPIANLLYRACRCGSVARFLIDLLAAGKIPARLIAAACHTSAEAWCQGRWILLDASLYPPGVVLRNTAQQLFTLEEAIANPALLDSPPSYLNYHHTFTEYFFNAYPETRATIGQYLDAPLLPSVGYFGEAFYVDRPAGLLQRYSKVGTENDWEKMPDYGWQQLHLAATAQANPCPTRQRPGQPRAFQIQNSQLIWQTGAAAIGSNEAIVYEIYLSTVSRGWHYAALPLDGHYTLPGRKIVTSQAWLDLSAIRPEERYLSVCAVIPSWQQQGIFFLPSEEVDIRA